MEPTDHSHHDDPGSGYPIASPDVGTIVVTLDGDIDLTASARLEYAIRSAETSDPEILIIDLEGVTFMDSTGVNALIGTELRARDAGRTLILTGLHQPKRTLEVAGLLSEFNLADSVAEAVAAYREGRLARRESAGGSAVS